jgi:TonB family protein
VRRVVPLSAFTLTLGLLCGLANDSPAQTTATSPTSTAERISPPLLTTFVRAVWPTPEPMRQGVSVLFELTIDANGHVAELSVIESAGAAFDRAAATALFACEFEPARRGTAKVRSRVRYRYQFQPPTETQAAEFPVEETAETDSAATLAAELPASGATSTNSPAEPNVVSVEPLAEASYAAVAQIAAPPREVTRRTVEQQDLTKIPGTSGDALRAIEVMPGVARTSISSGDPILRGAAWNESRSYIEGTTVPLLYHFGGVKSAFNSRLLSRVDIYPSNFGTSYGRAVGGVVSARVRDPEKDRFHALAEASVIDSMALLETPIGEKAAVAVAVRRSNIDYFFDAFAPKSSFNVVAAPTYYDYQALGSLQLHPRHQLRILAYGSRDAIRLIFANPSDFDPALRDNVDFAITYHRLQAALDSQYSPRLTQRVQLTYGYTTMHQMLGTLRAELTEQDFMSRGEWSYRAADSLRFNVGYDVEMLTMTGYYIGARPPQAEGEVMNGGMSTETAVDLSNLNRINAFRPATYTEVEWRPAAPILVVPGIRIDYYSDQGAVTINPRLSARYELNARFAIKWGIGTYSQNPQYYEMLRGFGNPALRPYHAQAYAAGFEHRPADAVSWGIEGFYKWLFNRVVATPGGQPPSFVNDGVGRVYGAELFARYAGTRLRGWLAYTLSRSERKDRRDPWRLFEKDQTHVLAATVNYRLGRGWEIGGRFRLTSGNPYTPVRAAVYDANLDVYRSVNAPAFSARNPTFHQLDLRVEKTWDFTQWKLACYLDVQNVYNAKNYEGFDYSYDFRQHQKISGLPVLPNLGLRGEL